MPYLDYLDQLPEPNPKVIKLQEENEKLRNEERIKEQIRKLQEENQILKRKNFMTSANVTEFSIFRNGIKVGTHYQNHLCKDTSPKLLRFIPLENHIIQAHWLDEEEEYHEGAPINLLEWLKEKRWFQTAGKVLPPRKV